MSKVSHLKSTLIYLQIPIIQKHQLSCSHVRTYIPRNVCSHIRIFVNVSRECMFSMWECDVAEWKPCSLMENACQFPISEREMGDPLWERAFPPPYSRVRVRVSGWQERVGQVRLRTKQSIIHVQTLKKIWREKSKNQNALWCRKE